MAGSGTKPKVISKRRLVRYARHLLPDALWHGLKRAAVRVGIGPRGQLLRLLPERSRGVEIGVWKGQFSLTLLKILNPRELHLIDPWVFTPQHEKSWYGGAGASGQRDMDQISRTVRQRFAHDSRVFIRRAPSLQAATIYPDEHFDWIYLDANHTYDAVAADLAAWLPKLRKGGLMCCDDYGVAGWWEDGVTRAVCDIIRSSNLIPRFILGGQIALEKP